MLEKFRNMGRTDRILRFILGWALIFLGLVYTGVVDDVLLNGLIVAFGLMNVISAIVSVCPAYIMAKISTIRQVNTDSGRRLKAPDVDLDPAQLESNKELRRKLQFSIVLPMIALLVVFAFIAHDLDHRAEMMSLTRHVDVSAELAARETLQRKTPGDALEKETRPSPAELTISELLTGARLFVHHDSQGNILSSRFNTSDADEALSRSWSRQLQTLLPADTLSARGMMMFGDEMLIWSSSRVEGTDHWYTGIIDSPTAHSITSYLISPGFLVLICAVSWLAIWSSTYIVGIFVDRMEKNSRQLQYRSLHDALTGLPNRQNVNAIIQRRLNDLKDESECVVLVMIDIIDFRVINETLGYALGDQLLSQIADCLRKVEPETTDVVRMGGDIFCLVGVVDQNRVNASRLANQAHDTLECAHELNGIPVGLQIRTGLSLGPADASRPEDLVRFADIALAQAKSKRVKDCFYQQDQDSHSIRKLALLARLRTAIEQNELTLVYQPKVDIASNTLAGVEVLVRWYDDEYGQVSPAEFVSWAEKSGLIDKLTQWVLINAEKQCREWRDRGIVIPFAINLSPTNLFDKKLIPLVTQLVNEGSFGDGMLELEITENAVMEDPERAVQAMRVLAALGVKFAIDDFGTGLSSFSYLRTLPVSNLKIDRAFIVDTDNSDKDAVLLRSMIKLGHGLGCVVTAEGVEDEEALERLRHYHCDHVQGYHICRPVPADKLVLWLQSCNWPACERAA